MSIFPNRTEWKQEKIKYGIPEKLVKSGSFGERVEALGKKCDKLGLPKTLPFVKVPDALALAKQADALFDEWLVGAKKTKPTDFKSKIDRDKAIALVESYKGRAELVREKAAVVKDPFHMARRDYDKCLKEMADAVAHPTDTTIVGTMYSDGMRNLLGQTFQKLGKASVGDAELDGYIKRFNTLVVKWHKPIATEGKLGAICADPALRKRFIDDMQDAMEAAGRALTKTMPKRG